MHGCRPRKKPSPKAQAQKSPPRVFQGPCWQRWRLLGLYTLEWWDQDKCFWNWWLQTVWRRKGEEYKEKCMVPTVKHGGGSVLMWAAWVLLVSGSCISLMASWIHKCTASILKEKMLPSLRALGRRALFQHDMILNTHLRPLLGFSEEEQVESDSVAKYVSWFEPNRTPMGNSEEDKLSITLHPASNL